MKIDQFWPGKRKLGSNQKKPEPENQSSLWVYLILRSRLNEILEGGGGVVGRGERGINDDHTKSIYSTL